MSIETIAAILGWCTVVNFGMLALGTMMLICVRKPIQRIHSKITELSDDQLNQAYFQYLAQFKMLWIVFNLTPYLAIRVFIL